MKYESNFKDVKRALQSDIDNALNDIGAFITAESQARTPVDSGRLRREQGYDVGDNQVDIGTNVEYAEIIHDGSSKRRPQPFLKDAILQNIGGIERIVRSNLEK